MTGTGGDAGRRRLGRPASALGAVFAVLAALAGCRTEGGPLPRPEPDSPRPDVAFRAEFHAGPEAVGWSWTLRNDGDEPILVFAGPDRGEEGPAPTWVLGARGTTVELAQRLLATPEYVAFDEPYGLVPAVLQPGAVLSGVAEAPLPLATTLPWGADVDPERAVPASPREVYLCVGVGTAAEFGEELAAATPYVAHAEATARSQHQFCTDTEPLP